MTEETNRKKKLGKSLQGAEKMNMQKAMMRMRGLRTLYYIA